MNRSASAIRFSMIVAVLAAIGSTAILISCATQSPKAPVELVDFTVFSQDIMTVPEEKILETEVVYTIVDGEVIYER